MHTPTIAMQHTLRVGHQTVGLYCCLLSRYKRAIPLNLYHPDHDPGLNYGIKLGSAKDIRRCRLRGRDSLNALEAGDAMRSSGLWYLPLRQKMNYPIMHLQLISSSVVTKYIETSQQRCMDWKPRKSCLLCSYSLYTNTSPDSPRQQLTMTGVAGVEEIEDGLAVWLRPPRKHSTSLACIARVTWCL